MIKRRRAALSAAQFPDELVQQVPAFEGTCAQAAIRLGQALVPLADVWRGLQ